MNVAAILKSKGRDVATVSREATLQAATEVLASRKIGAVVVCGDAGSVVGILSERDIIRAIAANGPSCLSKPVSRAMTYDVITCDESQTVDAVMGVMTNGRFRHVPVIDNGALAGIVSIGDVVKSHIAEVEHEAEALRAYLSS
ncbi:MAG: CBS domain-containing protein [Pseudomonadota bacterium]